MLGVVKYNIQNYEEFDGGIIKSIKVEPKNISHVSVKNNGLMGVTLISGQFMLLDPKTGESHILLVANGDNYIFNNSRKLL